MNFTLPNWSPRAYLLGGFALLAVLNASFRPWGVRPTTPTRTVTSGQQLTRGVSDAVLSCQIGYDRLNHGGYIRATGSYENDTYVKIEFLTDEGTKTCLYSKADQRASILRF